MFGAVTSDIAAAVFGKRRRKNELPPFMVDLIKHELSIIPIFWDNHWFLGLLQIYTDSDEDSVSGRLALVDSMYNDPVNKDVLARISDSVHFHLSIAVKAALVTSPKPRELRELSLIRCDSLPCQDNHSDCGWYMCLFGEYFAKNRDWMNFTNEQLQHMSFNVLEDEEFHMRLSSIKREVGSYLERAAGRRLNFEYDKVATSNKSSKTR
ncbi:hypothetical protein OESDEN_14741 [Oesophagostomum dentatum]|uniref:Ubiquitin-like protease family profile domain-containing protein n=1 Tax=Oesophagostomum dentatum TaxID=61180 RepID=A0A0B1SQP6_OESDE|nr:hypothetical protein OESDEN_14741 [Oesophagostomum dentatum]